MGTLSPERVMCFPRVTQQIRIEQGLIFLSTEPLETEGRAWHGGEVAAVAAAIKHLPAMLETWV